MTTETEAPRGRVCSGQANDLNLFEFLQKMELLSSLEPPFSQQNVRFKNVMKKAGLKRECLAVPAGPSQAGGDRVWSRSDRDFVRTNLVRPRPLSYRPTIPLPYFLSRVFSFPAKDSSTQSP